MKKVRAFIIIILVMILVVSCSRTKNPVISVTGLTEATFSQKELESMKMINSEYTNKDGEVTIFNGIPVIEILESAGVTEFSKVTLIASDKYSNTITSDELINCGKCVLAFIDGEGWRAVMPDFSSKLQIKDVVRLMVE